LKDRLSIINESKYQGTILYNYLKEIDVEEDAGNTNEGVHWTKFIRSIQNFYDKYNTYLKSDSSELCINLRCGDIVTDDQWHKSCYIFNNEKLLENIKKIFSSRIEKITIVTALHYGSDEIDNRFFFNDANYYLNLKYLSSIFHNLNKTFKIPTNIFCTESEDIRFIDEQFVKLIYSKHCIFDHGGFGKLINEVRSRL